MEIQTDLNIGQTFFVFDPSIFEGTDERCYEIKISKEKVTGINIEIAAGIPYKQKTICYTAESGWVYKEYVIYKTRKDAFIAMNEYFNNVFDKVEGITGRSKE